MRIDWHKYISVDPEIHHGEPCSKGTRIPVPMKISEFFKELGDLVLEAVCLAD